MIGLKAFFFILLWMPIGHIIMVLLNLGGRPVMIWGAVGLTVLGLAQLVATRYMRSQAWQSFHGAVAGILLWTGLVEYGLKFGAGMLGLQEVDGTLGEYQLLKHTWPLALLVMIYLAFQEHVRCPFFAWIRGKLNLTRGKVIQGSPDNYGPRTAFEMVTLLWVFYILLLLAYDKQLFGPHHFVTYTIFVGSFAATVYLLPRLIRIREMGRALRYAIPTVIILWNTVEIAAKWGLFTEPWLSLNRPIVASIFVAFGFSIWLVLRDRRLAGSRN